MEHDINFFKEKLQEELRSLEEQLNSLGRKNPDNPKDWEQVPEDLNTDRAEETEVADRIEEFDTNESVMEQLEIRYNEVKSALDRIESSKYGICEISGEQIEDERLVANPAARTCLKHKDEKVY